MKAEKETTRTAAAAAAAGTEEEGKPRVVRPTLRDMTWHMLFRERARKRWEEVYVARQTEGEKSEAAAKEAATMSSAEQKTERGTGGKAAGAPGAGAMLWNADRAKATAKDLLRLELGPAVSPSSKWLKRTGSGSVLVASCSATGTNSDGVGILAVTAASIDMTTAALQIQTLWRAALARKRFGSLHPQALLVRSAIAIQRCWRCRRLKWRCRMLSAVYRQTNTIQSPTVWVENSVVEALAVGRIGIPAAMIDAYNDASETDELPQHRPWREIYMPEHELLVSCQSLSISPALLTQVASFPLYVSLPLSLSSVCSCVVLSALQLAADTAKSTFGVLRPAEPPQAWHGLRVGLPLWLKLRRRWIKPDDALPGEYVLQNALDPPTEASATPLAPKALHQVPLLKYAVQLGANDTDDPMLPESPVHHW